MRSIVVNGKFIGAPMNGVHRMAALYTEALLAHRGDGPEIDVLAPRNMTGDPVFDRLAPTPVRGGLGGGQAWEMVTLPRAAQGRLLVNFCNLGPVAHRRSVVMIHDAQTFLYPEDYTGRQAIAYRLLLPIIARRAVRVLTVSEFARQSLAENGVAALDKTVVVHNGTDHLDAVQADETVLESDGLCRGGYALAFGSSKSYKNIERVFAAFDHPDLADLPLVIMGGPTAATYRDLGLSVPASARFLGSISDATLRALYTHAAMFLFPSRTEGFGLPPLEAMSCGCPVIAASAGAMPEVCGDGAILLDPEDTEAWRAAILQMWRSGSPPGLSDAAAARAKHFSWKRASQTLWSALSDLL
jgi:glycosyltransferase involved in cell wall biosynthesis